MTPVGRMALGFSLLCAAASAAVAAAPPLRLRGTIDAIDGQTLHMTSRTGSKVDVAVTAATPVIQVVPAQLDQIKKGDFIGTAARPGANGTLVAQEVSIFPEAMRGTGEGHYAWDTGTNSSMTNANVASVAGTSGRTLTLDYPGGEQHVDVPTSAPIVTFQPGSQTMLTPGAHVIVFASKAAGGQLSAARIAVGANGLTPPM